MSGRPRPAGEVKTQTCGGDLISSKGDPYRRRRRRRRRASPPSALEICDYRNLIVRSASLSPHGYGDRLVFIHCLKCYVTFLPSEPHSIFFRVVIRLVVVTSVIHSLSVVQAGCFFLLAGSSCMLHTAPPHPSCSRPTREHYSRIFDARLFAIAALETSFLSPSLLVSTSSS